jgi:hypothetical protein
MGYSPRLYSLSRGKYHECIISPKLDFNIWYIHMLEMAKTTAFWWFQQVSTNPRDMKVKSLPSDGK